MPFRAGSRNGLINSDNIPTLICESVAAKSANRAAIFISAVSNKILIFTFAKNVFSNLSEAMHFLQHVEPMHTVVPMKQTILFLAALFFATAQLHAQKTTTPAKNDLIQFSGVVVEADSLRPVPYTSVMIKSKYRGTVSDFYGYFSFVAQKKDTIQFSAIGFRDSYFVIPDTLTTNKYSLIQVLATDTVYLKEAVVYPWPSKEQFKQAFLSLDIPDDDLSRAQKNLARMDTYANNDALASDPGLNYQYTMQQYQSKLYYAGQLPPNNLLNPIAWSKFIKAWKDGEFKKKKKKND